MAGMVITRFSSPFHGEAPGARRPAGGLL